MKYLWNNADCVAQKSYMCGYCGNKVGPNFGYSCAVEVAQGEKLISTPAYIYICPNCTKPTFIDKDGSQSPGVRFGEDVAGITDKGVQALYDEARDCTTLGAYTAAVLICRKILMNIAVHHGAEEGKKFVEYVDYLASKGYFPPNGKPWVDKIRSKGNEATHEIKIMTKDEAALILTFTEMLLRFIYELPSKLAGPVHSNKMAGDESSGDGN